VRPCGGLKKVVNEGKRMGKEIIAPGDAIKKDSVM